MNIKHFLRGNHHVKYHILRNRKINTLKKHYSTFLLQTIKILFYNTLASKKLPDPKRPPPVTNAGQFLLQLSVKASGVIILQSHDRITGGIYPVAHPITRQGTGATAVTVSVFTDLFWKIIYPGQRLLRFQGPLNHTVDYLKLWNCKDLFVGVFVV